MEEYAQLVRLMCRQLPPLTYESEEDEEEKKVDVMESNVHPLI